MAKKPGNKRKRPTHKRRPSSAQDYYKQGQVKSKRQDHEGAIKDFNNAIKLKQDYAEAYYN